MKYNLKKINLISRYNVFFKNTDNYNDNFFDLWAIFWNLIFSKKFLNKYIEDDFIKEKIDLINNSFKLTEVSNLPKIEEIYFSYKIFNNILSVINDYYIDNDINLHLHLWINHTKKLENNEDLINNIEYYEKTFFYKNILLKIFKDKFLCFKDEKIIYRLKVFWPQELIQAFILWKFLKSINKKNKIVIDFSWANEQFDFSWFKNILFDDYIDYQIYDNDFWVTIQNILYKLNNEKNIFDYWINFFIKNNFKEENISTLLWKKTVSLRFLPYKCYYNKCSFCTINSNNLYNYNSEYSYNFFINKWIEYIKKYNIEFISFKDEAIPPKVIVNFAKHVLKNNIKIIYQFRTRFDTFYNKNNCKILFLSWARFCWIWLEAATERVNEEIANKWEKHLSLKDKIEIISNFDNVWISFHNYSIMWFPWETDEEFTYTYNFLIKMIEKLNYYTCTPNIFHLMKNSIFYKEKEKYLIEIQEKEDENIFKLSYDFLVDWKYRNINLLNKYSNDIHMRQFLPWLKINQENFLNFWDFIDRSYIFYITKIFNRINPSKKFILKENFFWYNNFYNVSKYIQFIKNNELYYIYDWLFDKKIKINENIYNFILNYNDKKTLLYNSYKYIIDNNIIKFFIDNKILINKNTFLDK